MTFHGLSWMTGNPLLYHDLQINGGVRCSSQKKRLHHEESVTQRYVPNTYPINSYTCHFSCFKKKTSLQGIQENPQLPIHTSSMPASFSHFSPWWRSSLNWDDHSKTTHGFPVSECRSHLFLSRSRLGKLKVVNGWMDKPPTFQFS